MLWNGTGFQLLAEPFNFNITVPDKVAASLSLTHAGDKFYVNFISKGIVRPLSATLGYYHSLVPHFPASI